MPAKVALALARDNQVSYPVPTKPRAKPKILTGHAYAVLPLQRVGGFPPSTAVLYAALAGLIPEQA